MNEVSDMDPPSRSRPSRLRRWLRRTALRSITGDAGCSDEVGAELGMDAFVLGDWEGAAGATLGLLARWKRHRQARRQEAEADSHPSQPRGGEPDPGP